MRSPTHTTEEEHEPEGPEGLQEGSSAEPEWGTECSFHLVEDPGPYPLVRGMKLSIQEVIYGLRLGGFNPGTVLEEVESGAQHRVRKKGRRWVLEPPCPRLAKHASLMGRGKDE